MNGVKTLELQSDVVVDIGEEALGYVQVTEPEEVQVKELGLSTYEVKKYTYIEAFLKRSLDILAGIVGVIVLIPLTIIIFIANKISKDDGPLFYTQERIGKDGKVFKMLKYRSMVVGADEKLYRYLEENEDAKREYTQYKKLKNDPRVTKIGNFIRKTSIDEMPQLLHVLTGKMTLVGPRPYLPREKEDMGEYYSIVVRSKPGITGLWQVSGRSEATFDERLDMDAVYDKEKSFVGDIKILYKTALHVLKKEGAI